MVAFSVDILSEGNPSLPHAAISASSVSIDKKSMPSVMAIGVWGSKRYAISTVEIKKSD